MNAPEPTVKSNAHQGKKILFIPLEFLRWQQARSMTYAAQLALEEGFEASGVEFTTLPALWDFASSAQGSWLSRAKTLLAGQTFDQVWVTLVHSHFEDDFLEWLRTLAPIRIGFVVESLEYTAEECLAHPPFRARRAYVEHQMRNLTHVLTLDEHDAARLNAAGVIKALWWPGAVPARLVTDAAGGNDKLPAVFYGAIYGERADWMKRADLNQLLVRPPAPEDATSLPQDFDKLQQTMSELLLQPAPVTRETFDDYLPAWRKLRRDIFNCWMDGLPKACAQVNLPSHLKAYSSRVVEAVAAGCPVISWDIPDRPRNRNLFREGEEILFFRRDQPEQLAALIRHLQREPEWARNIAARAQAKVAAFHTIEKRVRQALDWVATGLQPDYGEAPISADVANPKTMNPTPGASNETDAYYVNMFINDPAWSAPAPNEDESARWARICSLLDGIAACQPAATPWRILNLGCGRGWLTNLLTRFGQSEGVEPVAAVAAQAQKLFPNLRFRAGTAETILNAPDFQSYDLVLTSEVIEHVPRSEQAQFVRNLGRLLKPGGHVVLTTPRGESLREWTRLSGDPGQPVEDWLAEPALRQLFVQEKFNVVGQERVLFSPAKRQFVSSDELKTASDLLAIYQVWAFQLPVAQSDLAVSPLLAREAVLTEFHRACHDAADRGLQLLPDDSVLLTARARALLELGEPEAARQLLAWVIALQAEHAPARRLLARALRQLGRTREAEAQINRAAQLESVAAPSVGKAFAFLEHWREGTLQEGGLPQLEIRSATINDQTAPCIYLHPPARLRFKLPASESGRLTCAIAMQPEAWDKPTAGGCEFFLYHNEREIFRKAINPRQFSAHRCWHEVSVDVPAATGNAHEFVFRTRAVGSPPEFRWALWREPVFRSQNSATIQLS